MEEKPSTPTHQLRFSVGDDGGVLETVPLRVLIIGEFGIPAHRRPAHPVPVAPDSFRGVLRDSGVEIRLEVPNLLANKPKSLQLDVPIRDLTDFTPEGLVRTLEPLRDIQAFREELQAFLDGNRSTGQLRQSLQHFESFDALEEPIRRCKAMLAPKAAPTDKPSGGPEKPPQEEPGEGALDNILQLVDTEEPDRSSESDTSSAFGNLLGSIAGGKRRSGNAPEVRDALQATEQVLARQVGAIVHDPRFQAVESAWRGLRFLIQRTDFREGIRIDILDIPREELAESFHRQVFVPEDQGASEVAPALIVLSHPLTGASQEPEMLQSLAEQAEQLQVPLLAGLSPAFFGLEPGEDLAQIGYPGSLFEQPRYLKWNALRTKAPTRWLAVACNRFLLREGYEPRDRNSLGLREPIAGPGEHLWGSPVWAVASLVTRSFARTGWPTEITGRRGGEVENLPLRRYGPAEGGPTAEHTPRIPLEGLPGVDLANDLADAGLLALTGELNTDSAYLLRAPMLHGPAQPSAPPGKPVVGLGYQLAASRLAELVSRNRTNLHRMGSREEQVQALRAFFSALLRETGAGARVEVQAQEADDGTHYAVIHARMGQAVMGGQEFELGFRLE